MPEVSTRWPTCRSMLGFSRVTSSLPASPVPLTTPWARMGSTSTPIKERRLDVVGVKPDALTEDHLGSMNLSMAPRTTSATEVSRRRASRRSQASMSGGKLISCRMFLFRFLGGAIHETIPPRLIPVKVQIQGSPVNIRKNADIIGKLKVCREASCTW